MRISCPRRRRNPLFIKSEFSHEEEENIEEEGEEGRNPLFIKSEFSPGCTSRHAMPFMEGSQSFIHQVRILSCVAVPQNCARSARACEVAILYSSSQNSLGTSATPCPAWAKI